MSLCILIGDSNEFVLISRCSSSSWSSSSSLLKSGSFAYGYPVERRKRLFFRVNSQNKMGWYSKWHENSSCLSCYFRESRGTYEVTNKNACKDHAMLMLKSVPPTSLRGWCWQTDRHHVSSRISIISDSSSSLVANMTIIQFCFKSCYIIREHVVRSSCNLCITHSFFLSWLSWVSRRFIMLVLCCCCFFSSFAFFTQKSLSSKNCWPVFLLSWPTPEKSLVIFLGVLKIKDKSSLLRSLGLFVPSFLSETWTQWIIENISIFSSSYWSRIQWCLKQSSLTNDIW